MKPRHLLFAALVFFLSCSTGKKKGQCTIITNVGVFDGYTYTPNTNFVFDSMDIVAITKDALAYEGKRIDGKGKTIIPPLLNAHVHIWNEKNLRQAQDAGVFALLDMHAQENSAARMRQYRDSLRYAYAYSAGAGATVPGGHGTQWGPMPTINDSVSPRTFVERRVINGADYIKILCERHMPANINYTQTRGVIETAHALEKLCVAHISHFDDAAMLTLQHVDGFVHIWENGTATEKQLGIMKKRGIFIVPTLNVLMSKMVYLDSVSGGKRGHDFTPLYTETKKAWKAGIPVLAGTDAPNFNFNYGDALYWEMQSLYDAGIPAMEVLKAATVNVSHYFKLRHYHGLKPRSEASFILVEGNPVEDISAMRNRKEVWKKGKK
ncbi:MAG TPA: amidohydrolase family protein, partial [Flavobacteriales bacterium]|nr:amidohydrolase family protein [Flavobacteriales bacterium]